MGIVFGVVGVETPKYTTVEPPQGANYQLRDYGPQLVARYVGGKDTSTMFRGLANYIGAFSSPPENTPVVQTGPGAEPERIAMTAPVLSDNSPERIAMTAPVLSDSKTSGGDSACPDKLEFVLPSKYTMATCPKPKHPGISLAERPARRVAVATYSWSTNIGDASGRAQKLIETVEKDGMKYAGRWQLAQYNPPFCIPFLKTNEIWVEVEKKA